MRPSYTVFLCSTYADLAKERGAILDGIRKLQLQHDSMEFFGARASRPIEACLDEVRQSDIVVVVVGHLYGIIEAQLGVSFSEAEYQEAFRLRKPCLVYLRDEDVPVLPKHVEQDSAKRTLLGQFKRTLEQRHLFSRFRYSDDLATQVTADLSRQVVELNRRAELTLEGHLGILKKGSDEWNAWRAQNRKIRPNLAGANLSRQNLQFFDFYNTDLTGADLSDTTLLSASFRGATLARAKLHGALLGETVFVNTDLSETAGLDLATHTVQSFIGVETLYRSRNLPDDFLRQGGVPDHVIAHWRSLVQPVFEYYSCFLSYSSKDQEFAERLHADLQAKNIRVWFAPEDLRVGDKFQERIEESIRLYDKIIVVLSRESVRSPWIEREVSSAREREDIDQRTVLFPIRTDDAVMNATASWAANIRRTRHIGDFTGWKDHDTYQKLSSDSFEI